MSTRKPERDSAHPHATKGFHAVASESRDHVPPLDWLDQSVNTNRLVGFISIDTDVDLKFTVILVDGITFSYCHADK